MSATLRLHELPPLLPKVWNYKSLKALREASRILNGQHVGTPADFLDAPQGDAGSAHTITSRTPSTSQSFRLDHWSELITHIHQNHKNHTHQFSTFFPLDILRFHLWLGSCDVTTTTGGWHLDVENDVMWRGDHLTTWWELVLVNKFMSCKLN